jgi:hypothetical protein
MNDLTSSTVITDSLRLVLLEGVPWPSPESARFRPRAGPPMMKNLKVPKFNVS